MGKWIRTAKGMRCSDCRKIACFSARSFAPKYCPNCGHKMNGITDIYDEKEKKQ